MESFASANGIAWVRFGKDDRKIDVMQPYLGQAGRPAGPRWLQSAWPRRSSGSGPPAPGQPKAPPTQRWSSSFQIGGRSKSVKLSRRPLPYRL